MSRRFKLVPLEEKSANEQLWEAARIATAYEIRRRHIKAASDEELDELFCELQYRTVTAFMRRMVFGKGYNRNQPFWNNVWSCCYSVAPRAITLWMEEIKRRISAIPLSVSNFENDRALMNNIRDTGETLHYKREYNRKYTTYESIRSPGARVNRVKEEYEDYMLTAQYLGVTAMPFDKWLAATGYDKDEAMMEAMQPKNERRRAEYRKCRDRWLAKKRAKEQGYA